MSKRQVVTILSTNFAGSHYLSLLLGSHRLAKHAGEIKYLRRAHRERSCPICQDLSTCPLIKGLNSHTIDQCYKTIFQNFDERGEQITALIDTSKKVKWAEKFVGRQDYDYRYIHLLRDPRALVRRWTNSLKTWKESLHTRWHTFKRSKPVNPLALCGNWTEVLIQKWLNENQQIEQFCSQNRLPVLTVTYRDLCQDVLDSSLRITRFLALPDDLKMLEYWKIDHHGTAKPEYKWGQNDKPQGFQDLRWQKDLSASTIDKINYHKRLNDYLTRKNLILMDDGLTVLNKSVQLKKAA